MSDITLYNYSFNPITRRVIPLGLLYIKSVLKKNGYEVELRDFQLLNKITKRNVIEAFDNSADIIGIGCTSVFLPSLLLVLSEVKKKYPEKIIILGGPGPSVCAEDILKISNDVNIVVIGEGEETIVEVMNCIKKNKSLDSVMGIAYKENGKIFSNRPRPPIKNLDDLPFPDYEGIDLDNSRIYIMTARGCPYKCGFCFRTFFWGDAIRLRSTDKVIEEILIILKKTKTNRMITIYDDLFTYDKKRVLDFCEKIKKEKIDIKWVCFGRINLVDEEMIKKMAESGCVEISYGVESGSCKILEKIGKHHFTPKKVLDIVRKTRKYMNVCSSFIWGYPFETMKDFECTIELMSKLAFDEDSSLNLGILTPFLRTPIYEKYKDDIIPLSTENLIIVKNFSRFLMNSVMISVNKISDFCSKDMLQLYKKEPKFFIPYTIFKTPCLRQKIKIMEEFEEKYKLYNHLKGRHEMFFDEQ